ncbi:MAG: metal-sensitive transcriptional regulator [Dehalococcoidales bacterium]|nr:metal-sensitive transcriptional regulator [Dehalococcoidales bacterium]
MASYLKDKQEILVRLRRMEGQLKGIQRMIDADEYCVDVLNQLSSVIAATQKVASIILADHIKGCVRDALTHGERNDEYVNELVKVVERFTNRK